MKIGRMPVAMPAKLLRVLDEGEVGASVGDKPIKVNVRVVVANASQTSKNIVKRIRSARFLFHRILFVAVNRPCSSGGGCSRSHRPHCATVAAQTAGRKNNLRG